MEHTKKYLTELELHFKHVINICQISKMKIEVSHILTTEIGYQTWNFSQRHLTPNNTLGDKKIQESLIPGFSTP